MSTLALHSALLTRRSVTSLVRQPAFVAITLVQPAIWLLLFGALFETAVQIPGFGADGRSYLEYLTPGVVAMTALFSAAWAGTVYIEDMTLGVMDRMLASPVRRGAMMNGTIAYQSITAIVQTTVIIGIAYAAGARFDRPFPGIVLTFAAAVLLTVVFAALSNAVALLSRDQNSLIGISRLPVAARSPSCRRRSWIRKLAPDWIQTAATYNPLDWAVVVSREGLAAAPDWAAIWPRLGALTALAILMNWLATKAFTAYQRSVWPTPYAARSGRATRPSGIRGPFGAQVAESGSSSRRRLRVACPRPCDRDQSAQHVEIDVVELLDVDTACAFGVPPQRAAAPLPRAGPSARTATVAPCAGRNRSSSIRPACAGWRATHQPDSAVADDRRTPEDRVSTRDFVEDSFGESQTVLTSARGRGGTEEVVRHLTFRRHRLRLSHELSVAKGRGHR